MWPGPASAERWYRQSLWAHRRGDRQRRQSEHTGRGVAAASLGCNRAGSGDGPRARIARCSARDRVVTGARSGSLKLTISQITGGIAISSGTAGAWARTGPDESRTTANVRGTMVTSAVRPASARRRRPETPITAAVPKAVAAPSASTVDTGPVVTGAPVPALGTWWTGVPPPDPAPG